MRVTPDSLSLGELLELVRKGRLALPQFQRDFVWPPGAVVELLHSVARRWPVGSLMFLEGPQEFASRPIEDAPPLTTGELLVLDGQQRVTALFRAFADVGDEVYFVDLDAVDAEEDEFVLYRTRTRFDREFPTLREMAEAEIAPIPIIYSDSRFYEWLSFVPKEERRRQLVGLREHSLEGLKGYDIPLVRLPRDVEMPALAKIFETINRTGVRLATFDLMVARLYPSGFDLTERWDAAVAALPETLQAYQVNGIEILKLIALREHLQQRRDDGRTTVKGVRESDVLALPASLVTTEWERAVETYAQAVSWARERCGCASPELIPSVAMLLPLAAALVNGVDERELERWFINATLDQDYAQGANTQAVADARVLTGLAGPQHRMRAFDLDGLFESRRRNEMLLRGLLALLVHDGAGDWTRGSAPLRAADPRTLVVRRVFPRKHLSARGAHPDVLLNFVVVGRDAHREMQQRPPSDYLDRLDVRDATLLSQGCDPGALRTDDWPMFARTRFDALADVAQRATAPLPGPAPSGAA
jgi:hypothetical protein